jgi:hypothetical protein
MDVPGAVGPTTAVEICSPIDRQYAQPTEIVGRAARHAAPLGRTLPLLTGHDEPLSERARLELEAEALALLFRARRGGAMSRSVLLRLRRRLEESPLPETDRVRLQLDGELQMLAAAPPTLQSLPASDTEPDMFASLGFDLIGSGTSKAF